MNHESFIAAIGQTIGTPPPLPGTSRWSLEFPHGGKLEIHPFPENYDPGMWIVVSKWPAAEWPDGASQHTSGWDIVPVYRGSRQPGDAEDLRKVAVRELARRLALVGYVPPASPAAVPAEGDREAGLAEDDGDCYWCKTEREDVIRILRTVCTSYGSNDWSDNLHLGDVIEKHLYNYLAEEDAKVLPMTEGDESHPLWSLDAQIRGLLEGDGATEDLEAVKDFFQAAGLPESTAARVRDALCSAEAEEDFVSVVQRAFEGMTEEERKEALEDYCRVCLSYCPDGCHCSRDE